MRIWGCTCRRTYTSALFRPDFFIGCAGLFASKPAPTFDRVRLDNSVKCGSGLAREGHAADLTPYNLAIDTSVDFTNAITSLPTTSSSSFTERVVITEVTMPDAVCTSISDSTSPSTISLIEPLNWLRTLMALIVLMLLPVVE